MQIILNVLGYEVFIRAAKRPPTPHVFISHGDKLDVQEVVELLRYTS